MTPTRQTANHTREPWAGRSVVLARLVLAPALLVGVLVTLVLSVAPAFAGPVVGYVKSLGAPGSAAGEMLLSRARQEFAGSGVAVSATTHDVYVADTENHRVDEFKSDGAFVRAWGWGVGGGSGFETCTATCQIGLSGSGPGEFKAPVFIAVDNSTGGASAGDVYVGDAGDNVVSKFTAEGALVKSWGTEGQLASDPATGPKPGPFGPLEGIAVESAGDLDILEREEYNPILHVSSYEGVLRFGQEGVFLNSVKLEREYTPAGLAVDSEGNLFRVLYEGAAVGKYTLLGSELGRVTFGGEAGEASGLAAYGNELYVAGAGIVRRYAFTGPTVVSEPGGQTCEIATERPCPPTESFGSGEAGGGSLTGGSGIAVDPSDGHVFVTDAAVGRVDEFALESLSAPDVSGEQVNAVTESTATLQAEVNPHDASTSVHFEYGPCASLAACASSGYEASTPTVHVNAGFGFTAVAPQYVQGLQPGTIYHFRLVAENEVSEDEKEPAAGEEKTFTTPHASAFTLPDGRMWELVSPSDKSGGAVKPELEVGPVRAAANGGAFTFVSELPLFAEVATSQIFSQVLAQRGAAGWSSRDISPAHDRPDNLPVGEGFEYKAFSVDLSLAVDNPLGPFVALSPEATERTPYIRDNVAGSYRPLVTAANAPGVEFGGNVQEIYGPVKFADATPDLSHVALAGIELAEPGGGLYEWVAGKLLPVGVLPVEELAKGEVLGGQASIGSSSNDLGPNVISNAISEDGSRVFWEAMVAGVGEQLFVRDMAKGETLAIATSGEPKFEAASPDGSKVFFKDEAPLTSGSEATFGKPDLYECELGEVAGRLACTLRDLTTALDGGSGDVGTLAERGSVLGLGVSGPDFDLYVVAKGVLASNENENSEHAVAGAENLYLVHGHGEQTTTSFIAKLAAQAKAKYSSGVEYWTGDFGNNGGIPAAEVSPNGRYLAFMSERSLTGYDSADANNHAVHDEEVFLYDAQAGAGQRMLVCASCNPSGTAPAGVEEVPPTFADSAGVWRGRWVAAVLPQPERLEENGPSPYTPRYVSNNGRVFFDSHDALVPQDVNGQWDAYEYEPATTAPACTVASQTFTERTDGCTSLISSGTSQEQSAFLDASEGGHDVFFMTASQLVPQDTDNAIDVYDAHECTTASPCLEGSPAVTPPSCTTTESCRPGAAEQPELFGAPASATFSGVGNVQSSPGPLVKARGLTAAQKLAAALNACRRHRQKARRAVCEKRVKGKYRSTRTKRPRAKKAGVERRAHS
jgi:DNA-binding beta-propeller fold protein YncE